MEVKDPNAALLSNFELYKLLSEFKEESRRDPKRNRASDGLSTIVYETLKFLETSPAVVQTPDVIKEFCLAVASFKLTKAEKLQFLNIRPTTPVEIQLIVEECEERLSEEKVNELTEIINHCLPSKSDQSAGTVAASSSVEDMEQNE